MKTNPEQLKAIINAPCGVLEGFRKQYPTINCAFDCDACAFNPREKKRRLETGTWVNGRLIFKRRTFNGT